MEKIVIVGSPGAGKTTLARKLGPSCGFKVFHLDRMFWQDDWKKKPRDERIDLLQKFVMGEQWIIEGTYLNSSKIHLNAADTIIFLDLHPLLCLLRIIKRHFEYRGKLRRDLPKGCKDKITLHRVMKVLLFPLRERRTLKRILRDYKSKQIIRLRSTKEVENFLAKQAKSFNTAPIVRERLPVLAIR